MSDKVNFGEAKREGGLGRLKERLDNLRKLIPELNGLMQKVKEGHDRLIDKKRSELLEIVRQCMEEIHTVGGSVSDCKALIEKTDNYFSQQKSRIAELESLQLLDGLVPQMWSYKDDACDRIDTMKQPKPVTPVQPVGGDEPAQPVQKKVIKTVYRQVAFPSKTLTSKEDIDAYVERMRSYLETMLKDCDGVKLQ